MQKHFLDPIDLNMMPSSETDGSYSLEVEKEEEPTLPDKFRLFKYGLNESSKGSFYVDDAAIEKILSNFHKKGNKLAIDYDHESMAEISPNPAQSKKAAGYFLLECDPETKDIMAVNVKWTRSAMSQLLEGEFKYISPSFYTETMDDGRELVSDILNAALTINPALYGQKELVNVLSIQETPSNKNSEKTATSNINNNKVNSMTDEELALMIKENEELKAFVKASQKKEVEALILNAIKEQRLDSKHRKYAEGIGEKEGVEGLKQYLSTLSARPGAMALTAPKTETPSISAEYVDDEEGMSEYEKREAEFLKRPLRDGEQVMANFLGIKPKKYNKNLLHLQDVKATGPNTVSATVDFSAIDRKKRSVKGVF